MKNTLARLGLIAAVLTLSACANPVLDTSQEYDYVLSCKLREDDPKRCEAQIRNLCPTPAKAVTHKSRTVDPKDNAVTYVYQARCGD
ncbi:MAG: hypothetical protein LBI66_00095 [Burkholderiaceae bacterium]|jgi:ABC-type uncharacterized transport system auxiliary subunit|nr:hypothetical protein [Burkholderiaceae bacterium]